MLFSDDFRDFEVGAVGGGGGGEGFGAGDGTLEDVFPEDVDLGAHVQQGFDAGSVQFAQLFNEMDHLLEVLFDGFLFRGVEFQPGKIG